MLDDRCFGMRSACLKFSMVPTHRSRHLQTIPSTPESEILGTCKKFDGAHSCSYGVEPDVQCMQDKLLQPGCSSETVKRLPFDGSAWQADLEIQCWQQFARDLLNDVEQLRTRSDDAIALQRPGGEKQASYLLLKLAPPPLHLMVLLDSILVEACLLLAHLLNLLLS